MMNRQIFSCTYQSLKKLLVQHQPVVVRLNSHQTNAVSDIRADTGTENFQQSKDYYKQKLLQFGVGIKVPIQTLIRYHREAPPQIRNVFSSRSTKEFKTFLSRYPDTFKIVNENVLLVTGCEPTTNTRNNKLERLCDGNCPKSARKTSNQTSIIRSMPGASATQSNIRIISSTRESKFVTNAIMNSAGDGQIVVSLDCEGMGLGADGKLSLIQLGIPCGEVYIFDVLKCPQIIRFGGLKSLLESDRVIKIVHDCRGDSANLFAQFSVMLRCVFDTQAAQTVLQYQEEGMPIYEVKNLSLNQLCEWYNVPSNQRKDDVKRMYKQDPNVWAQRPLDSDMLQYAAEDVLVLINEQLYGTMASAIKPGFKALLSDLCTERILTTILPNEIKLRVTARNVADLRKKLSMKNVTLTDFELKLLESSDLPDDEKEKFYAAHKSSEDLNKPKVLDQENNAITTAALPITNNTFVFVHQSNREYSCDIMQIRIMGNAWSGECSSDAVFCIVDNGTGEIVLKYQNADRRIGATQWRRDRIDDWCYNLRGVAYWFNA